MGGFSILPQLEQAVSRPAEGNAAIAIALFQICNLRSVKADGIILTIGQNINKLIHLIDTQTAHIPGIQIALCALTIDIKAHNLRNLVLRLKEIGICFASAQRSFIGIIAAVQNLTQRILQATPMGKYMFNMGISIGIHILQAKIAHIFTGGVSGCHNNGISIFYILGR